MGARLALAEGSAIVEPDVDPRNQIRRASNKPGIEKSLVVPVLPATGRSMAFAAWPVPRCITSSIILVIKYAVSFVITSRGSRLPHFKRVCPHCLSPP